MHNPKQLSIPLFSTFLAFLLCNPAGIQGMQQANAVNPNAPAQAAAVNPNAAAQAADAVNPLDMAAQNAQPAAQSSTEALRRLFAQILIPDQPAQNAEIPNPAGPREELMRQFARILLEEMRGESGRQVAHTLFRAIEREFGRNREAIEDVVDRLLLDASLHTHRIADRLREEITSPGGQQALAFIGEHLGVRDARNNIISNTLVIAVVLIAQYFYVMLLARSGILDKGPASEL